MPFDPSLLSKEETKSGFDPSLLVRDPDQGGEEIDRGELAQAEAQATDAMIRRNPIGRLLTAIGKTDVGTTGGDTIAAMIPLVEEAQKAHPNIPRISAEDIGGPGGFPRVMAVPMAAGMNVLSGLIEGAASPPGAVGLMTGATEARAIPTVAAAFGAPAAAEAPLSAIEAARRFRRGQTQAGLEAGLQTLVDVGMGYGAAKAPALIERIPDALHRETAPVLQPVQTLAPEGARQMPVEKGLEQAGERGQPAKTEEKAPQPVQPAPIVLNPELADVKKLAFMPNDEVVKLAQGNKQWQGEGVKAGIPLNESHVPELERVRDEAQKAAMESLITDLNSETGQTTPKTLALQAKVIWLNGAIEGAKKKGANYDAVIAQQAKAKPVAEPTTKSEPTSSKPVVAEPAKPVEPVSAQKTPPEVAQIPKAEPKEGANVPRGVPVEGAGKAETEVAKVAKTEGQLPADDDVEGWRKRRDTLEPKVADADAKLDALKSRINSSEDPKEKESLRAEWTAKNAQRSELKDALARAEGAIGLARMRAETKGQKFPPATPPKITTSVLKTQKENLLGQLDDAIKKAPDQSQDKITISVPGDGEFTVRNTKDGLKKFREIAAKQFPTSVEKQKEGGLKTIRSTVMSKVSEPKAADLGPIASTFVSSDPNRYVITHVYSDGTQMVSTDGKQLLRIVSKDAPGKPDSPVFLDEKGKPTTAPEGQYPNFAQVMLQKPELVRGSVKTEDIWKIAQQARAFLKDVDESKIPKAVELFVNQDGTIGGRAEHLGDLFEHNVQPNAIHLGKYDAQAIVDGMNAARRLGNELVDIYFGSPTDKTGPIMFRGKNHEHILMPIKISDSAVMHDPPSAFGPSKATHGSLPPATPPLGSTAPIPPKKPRGKKTSDETHADRAEAPPSANRWGTASGLPPGVPDRGPTFVQELMEASRRIGALARSKLTLRPGVLGQYVHQISNKRIEQRDIRNQLTMSHEIGHALDGILFKNGTLKSSQQSLVDRIGTGNKGALFKELASISEIMRGPLGGSAYRARASELIADWAAMYVHDPERARQMAPNWTGAVEDILHRPEHADTAQVIDQLIQGNVTPVAPVATAGSQIPTPKSLLGKVQARLLSNVPREREVATAAEGIVKGEVRLLESKLQGARVLGDTWRKDVPKAMDRNDVGAFVEGVGNLEIPGDTIEAVRLRMTPAKERLVKDYRFRQELQRQEINGHMKDMTEGEYLKFVVDYLGHFYADGDKARAAAVGRWAKNSPHANQRKIPTLKEAVDMGLTPLTQDPAVTYELTARTNWRVATNRKVIGELDKLRTTDNSPVILPLKQAPAGWVVSNNPLIERTYARKLGSGATQLWRGGAAIHPDAWNAVRQILEDPTSSDLGKAYDAINSLTRANAFAFSMFHDLTLRAAAAGSMFSPRNPFRGLVRIMERDPSTGELRLMQSSRAAGKALLQEEQAVSDAALHGLKFAWTDSEAYQKTARDFLDKIAAKTRDVPYLGKAVKLVRDLQQMRQEGLWKNTHDAFKILAYQDLTSKALQNAPKGTDPAVVKQRVASLLNDSFGGQEWMTKFWLSPKTRKTISRFMLAPDWTLSTIRSVPGASTVASTLREQAPRLAGREPFPMAKDVRGDIDRAKFWGGELAVLTMATIAAQYAINKAFGKPEEGDQEFPWENEYGNRGTVDVTPIMRQLPWHDPNDKTRHYVNLGKRPLEMMRWFTNPFQNAESKLSRPAAELLKQMTGMEGDFKEPWKQDHESFVESIPARAASVAEEFLPFAFKGNQFALTLPMRKGMTKFKAQQAFQSLYEVAAEPSKLKTFLRGQPAPEGALEDMGAEIADAAIKNGVEVEKVRKQALSVVRGHHYDLFLKATQKGDTKKMDQEAAALLRLEAEHFEQSVQRKGVELTPEQWEKALEAQGRAQP